MAPDPETKKAQEVAAATIAVWAVAAFAILYAGKDIFDWIKGPSGKGDIYKFLGGITLFGLAWVTSIGLSAGALKLPPKKDKELKDVRGALLATIVLTPIAPIILGKFMDTKVPLLASAALMVSAMALSVTQQVMLEK